MLNSVKKLQIFYAKSPEISLATSPAEQAVHGVLFTFNLRTFGYRLLLSLSNVAFTDYYRYGRRSVKVARQKVAIGIMYSTPIYSHKATPIDITDPA